MMDDGQERVKASYDAITNAWQTVKVKYDPGQSLPRQPEHPSRV
jgi:hypothetical protein